MKTCLNCDKEIPTRNKYCDIHCKNLYEWEHTTKKRIEEGNANTASASTLRYLIERDGYECGECGLDEWQGKFIRLDIDHVDGDRSNNVPNNLRLLCPNCHRQTPSWGNGKIDEVPKIYDSAMRLLK